MKIVLAALNAKYVHSNLAVYDLEAYAVKRLEREYAERNQEASENIELVVKEYTINHNLDMILQSLYKEKAEVVAFSCYIWNIREILSVANELKKAAPDTCIWLGGPEVSYDSRKLLEDNPFIDVIMQGEGEITFYELVKELGRFKGKSGRSNMYQGILGITYRNSLGEICENGRRPLMSLDEVPFIYKDLSRFENKILYYETSRGCPFSCSYCLSSIDKSVRFRSLKLVERELQFFLDNNVTQVKFIDRTFNCRREHALAVWKYITEHDNGITNFHFEVSIDLIGEEELEVFRKMRPGLIQLEIGLQSTNPATIKEIRRVMNIEKLKKNMLLIRSFNNIHQHLDLIAGLPYEDFDTFKKSFNDAYDMKPNQLQLGFLKVLKGSYMEERVMDYELKYQDVQPYEVLSTRWISYDEILVLKQVEEMVEVYYNSSQFEHVLSYLIPYYESPFQFYEALGKYYQDMELFGIGFRREARYEALRQFCKEWFGELKHDKEGEGGAFSAEIFDSLLTYDYYLRENAKSRPSWAKEQLVEKSVYRAFFENGGTEEINLNKKGYASKEAARMMHIEPLAAEAVLWIDRACSKFYTIMQKKCVYCLFDYDCRNPLSKAAKTELLSHL